MEQIGFFSLIILVYTWPLLLGLFAVWVYRTIVAKNDNYYAKDFVSGLIMLFASREFFRNFRTTKKH